MALSTDSTLNVLFKKFNDKGHTSNQKAYYEESRNSGFLIHAQDVWADEIPSSPAQAVIDGVAILYDKFVLTMDGTVADQKSWTALSGGLPITDFISPKYGASYTVELFDNAGTKIPFSDPMEWYFDYKSGILAIQNSHSKSTPFKITAYKYTGESMFAGGSAAGKVKADFSDPAAGFLIDKLSQNEFSSVNHVIEISSVSWSKLNKLSASLLDIPDRKYTDLQNLPDLTAYLTKNTAQDVTATKTFKAVQTFNEAVTMNKDLLIPGALTVSAQAGKIGIGKTPDTQRLEINGAVQLGAATTPTEGTIQYTGGDFQGRVGNRWLTLTGGSSGSLISEGSVLVQADYDNNRTGDIILRVGNLDGVQIVRHLFSTFPLIESVLVGIGKTPSKFHLEVAGGLQIGDTEQEAEGAIKFVSGSFLGYANGAWQNLINAPHTQNKSTISDFVEADYVHKTSVESISGLKTFSSILTLTDGLDVTGNSTFHSSVLRVEGTVHTTLGLSTAGKLLVNTDEDVESINSSGAIRFGNTTNPAPRVGTIRWTDTDFEGYGLTGWKSLTSLQSTGISSPGDVEIIFDNDSDGSGEFSIFSGTTQVLNINQQDTLTLAGSLVTQGNIVVGDAALESAGSIKYDSGLFSGYNGTNWLPLNSAYQFSVQILPPTPGMVAYMDGDFKGYSNGMWNSFTNFGDHAHPWTVLYDTLPTGNPGDTSRSLETLLAEDFMHKSGRYNQGEETIWNKKVFKNWLIVDGLLYARTSNQAENWNPNDPYDPEQTEPELNKVGIGGSPYYQKLEVFGGIKIGTAGAVGGLLGEGTLSHTGTNLFTVITDDSIVGLNKERQISLLSQLRGGDVDATFGNSFNTTLYYNSNALGGSSFTTELATSTSYRSWAPVMGKPGYGTLFVYTMLGVGMTPSNQRLEVNGAIQIGDTTISTEGTIKYCTLQSGAKDIQVYCDGVWKSIVYFSSLSSPTDLLLTYDNDNNGSGSFTVKKGLSTVLSITNNKEVYLSNLNFKPSGELTLTNTLGQVLKIDPSISSVTFSDGTNLISSFSNMTGTVLGTYARITLQGDLSLGNELSPYFYTTASNGGRVGIGIYPTNQKLEVAGGITVGDTSTATLGTIRYHNGDIEAYLNGSWQSLSSVTGGQLISAADIFMNYDADNNGTGELIIQRGLTQVLKIDNSSNITANINSVLLKKDADTLLQLTGTGKLAVGYEGKSGNTPQQTLDINGAVVIGNTSNDVLGSMRYNNDDIEAYLGGQWKSLTSVTGDRLVSNIDITLNYDYDDNGTGVFNLLKGTSQVIKADEDGNVVIGDSSATQKLTVIGAISLGDTSSNVAGSIRYHSGDLEGYVSGSWRSLTTVTGNILSSATDINLIYDNDSNDSGELIVTKGIAEVARFNSDGNLHLQNALIVESSVSANYADITTGIKIGDTTQEEEGTIRYHGLDVESFVDGSWKSLTKVETHEHLKNSITDFSEGDYVHTSGDELVSGNKTFTGTLQVNALVLDTRLTTPDITVTDRLSTSGTFINILGNTVLKATNIYNDSTLNLWSTNNEVLRFGILSRIIDPLTPLLNISGVSISGVSRLVSLGGYTLSFKILNKTLNLGGSLIEIGAGGTFSIPTGGLGDITVIVNPLTLPSADKEDYVSIIAGPSYDTALVIESDQTPVFTVNSTGYSSFAQAIRVGTFAPTHYDGGDKYDEGAIRYFNNDVEVYVNSTWKSTTQVLSHTQAKSSISDFTEEDYVHSSGDEIISGSKTFGGTIQITKLGVNTTATTYDFEVGGAIKIGTSTESSAGAIKYLSNDFWGYNGNSWVSFTAPGTHTHIKASISDFVESAYVHVLGNETIGGDKTFTGTVAANALSVTTTSMLTGNVMIGATTNTQALNVAGAIMIGDTAVDAAGTIRYHVTGGVGDVQTYVNGTWQSILTANVDTVLSKTDVILHSDTDGNTTGDIILKTGALGGNTVATFTNDGKVGIGTYPVNQMLEINGGLLLGNSTVGHPGSLRFTGSELQFYTAGDQNWMNVGRLYTHNQTTASSTWTVVHNLKTQNMVMTIYSEPDLSGVISVIFPNGFKIIDSNTVQVVFGSAIKGKVVFLA